MVRTGAGVSGNVEYDLDLLCSKNHDGKWMHPTEETSDKGNTIYECPQCGNPRAVNVHVAPVGGGRDE